MTTATELGVEVPAGLLHVLKHHGQTCRVTTHLITVNLLMNYATSVIERREVN